MIAPKVLVDYGHHVELVHIDTESNVDAARIAAERVINEGAHCIVGNVDSGWHDGHRSSLRAAPSAARCQRRCGTANHGTGIQYVARNFPHAGMLMARASVDQDLLDATKLDAKRRSSFYANDTFGQAQRGALDALFPRAGLPFLVTDHIAFDPRAQDLSVEVTKIRASNPDLVLMVVTRGNDAIKLIRDMVRQRFLPKAIISPGSSGLFEEEYLSGSRAARRLYDLHLPVGRSQVADGTSA